jgi:hypothetical protein
MVFLTMEGFSRFVFLTMEGFFRGTCGGKPPQIGGRTRQADRFMQSDSRPIRVARRSGCKLCMSFL